MVMFVLWEAPISMRVELKCASMISGGQSVKMAGTPLMLLLSVGNWDMHTPEVSINYSATLGYQYVFSYCQYRYSL